MSEAIGQLFSHTYRKPGAPTRDSVRLRRRLKEMFEKLCPTSQDRTAFGKMAVTERGMAIHQNVYGTYSTEEVFDKGELADVLDLVTLFYRYLSRRFNALSQFASYTRSNQRDAVPNPEDWRLFVARAMQEENVGYRVDDKCGVHYFIDEEFEHARAATLEGLGHPSLVAARAAYEDAFRHLDSQPRDTKAAVRSIFEAAEIVAKQIVPEAQRLNGQIIRDQLRAKCLAAIGGDATEQKALAKMFDSMADWVDGMHFYRHGQAADEPVSPSEELAVLAISSGSAYVRLLASVLVRGV